MIPAMRLQWLVVCFLMAVSSFSQLHLVTSQEQASLSPLSTQKLDMFLVTNQAYIVIGPPPTGILPGLTVTMLDSQWDEEFSYYILFPVRPQPTDFLANYGTILYESAPFIILKADATVKLSDERFQPYHISRITSGNVMPQFDPPLPGSEGTSQATTTPRLRHTPKKEIQALVDAVADDTLWAKLTKLTSMERYASNANTKKCAEYMQGLLKNDYKFDDVTLQEIGGNYSPNVVAVKYGEVKDSVFIVGGHYDVYAQGAQGADDNGSGAVAVLEAARVLSKSSFRNTLVFILFSAEESGFAGSAAYANKASQDKLKIGGMINIDVTLYRWDNKAQIDATYDNRSKDIFDSYKELIKIYQPSIPFYDGFNSQHKSSSDNASFWKKGYKALMTNTQLDDAHVNPNMHTKNDVMSDPKNCRPALVAVTRAAVAALATWGDLKDGTGVTIPLQKGFASDGVALSLRNSMVSLRIPPWLQTTASMVMLTTSKGQTILKTTIGPNCPTVQLSLEKYRIASGVYYMTIMQGTYRTLSRLFIE
ncbi:MAG: M20/M25/M40 family metallo-hydrolase [Chitinivibrionales bacterium]|nr:M20/M25/M40 family metallo-hydrolase [Chitinivibrionales bacterium]